MTFEIIYTRKFKKDLKDISGKENISIILKDFISILQKDLPLPPKFNDHALKGYLSGLRESHLKPDLLLIYEKDLEFNLLTLVRIGSHSKLRLS